MNSTLEHDSKAHRFVARLDDGEAELTYVEEPGRVLDLVHTFVPESARGGGVASDLVEFAFTYARENGYRVRATCPYVRSWLEEHPEQNDLLVSRR